MFQYERIAGELRRRIEAGRYETGRLPSERRLSEEFGVQRDTVRRARAILLDDGTLIRDSSGGIGVAPSLLLRGPASEALTAAGAGAGRSSEPDGVLLIARTLEESAVSSTIFRGLSNCLAPEGIRVFWHEPEERETGNPAPAERRDYLPSDDLLAERNIRGIVIWPRSWTPLARLRKLRETIPIVIVDRRMPGFEADFVGNRDFESGVAVTRHLVSLGHRRIGYLSGESWASTVQQRIAGYAAALAESGESAPPPRVLHQDGGSRCLAPAMLETFLAGDGDPLTAVICANDIMAARLIQFLRDLGKRVPEDVAVTGSGNLLPVMLDAFGLTTFAAPIEELGWAAGEMLLDRLRGKAGPGISELEIPMQLIVRESCGSRRTS